VNILLTGETGSGKERFARALHDSSERRRQPFVAVNCAALPESLIESELFGHLAGSFSGAASRGKRGLIQEADGGTLFLDEIGDMPLPLQGRLLRVLAEREVLPVGATRPVAVNLRVVAATHCDLVAAVKGGRFRDDLYYRLNGGHFHLPPLRDREDLGVLVHRLCADGSPAVRLSAPARARLVAHSWPGNLRELCNAIECARSLCSDGVVTPDDLPESLGAHPPGHLSGLWRPRGTARVEPAGDAARAWLPTLRQHRWNVSEAARQLGVSRMTLYRWQGSI
jgi:transcriptional regulator of acetoin/glycerol metabolism